MAHPVTEFLEKVYPKNGKLLVDKEGTIHTTIIDEEIDGIECKFNYDGCVEINTENYSYLTLSVENLIQLVELIQKADNMYKKRTQKQWDKFEKVS
jgi:hypothetical protein